MHDALMMGLPLVVIIAGILLNRQDVHALRGEMRGEMQALRSEMQAGFERYDAKMQSGFERYDAKMQSGFDLLHRDLRDFDRTIGQHDARIDAIDERSKKQ